MGVVSAEVGKATAQLSEWDSLEDVETVAFQNKLWQVGMNRRTAAEQRAEHATPAPVVDHRASASSVCRTSSRCGVQSSGASGELRYACSCSVCRTSPIWGAHLPDAGRKLCRTSSRGGVRVSSTSHKSGRASPCRGLLPPALAVCRTSSSVEYVSPALVVRCAAPAPVGCAAPAPAVEHTSPAPAMSNAAPASAVYAAPAPDMEYGNLAPAVSVAAPASVQYTQHQCRSLHPL